MLTRVCSGDSSSASTELSTSWVSVPGAAWVALLSCFWVSTEFSVFKLPRAKRTDHCHSLKWRDPLPAGYKSSESEGNVVISSLRQLLEKPGLLVWECWGTFLWAVLYQLNFLLDFEYKTGRSC